MDRQCQDRCHRIGQTRDVHIYRFVSEYTIEQNIMRKANQKRMLDNVVIGEGDFTTDFFNKVDWRDMLDNDLGVNVVPPDELSLEKALASAEDDDDAAAAQAAQVEMDVDAVEFAETGVSQGESERNLSTEQHGKELDCGETSDGARVRVIEIQEAEPGHIDDYMVRFIGREGASFG